jgi:hypothetical protein
MVRAPLTLLALLLVSCAAAHETVSLTGHPQTQIDWSVQKPLPSATGQTPGLLYWGGSYIMKIRLADDKDFRKQSYGDEGLMALVTDRKHRVHEAAFESDNSVVLEFGANLKVVRSFEVSFTLPMALAIDGSGEQYLGLYDGSSNSQKVEVFGAKASGSGAPLRTIAGNKTALTCIGAEAVDSAGYLYVANWGALCDGGPNNLLVFAPHVKGNEAPLRVVAGDQTGITGPVNLALGADGNIYVANEVSGGSSPTFDILVFPTTANGNVPPTRTLQTGSYGGTIALGTNGEMYVGQGPKIGDTLPTLSAAGGIAVYAPGASGTDSPIGYVGKDMERQAYRIALQYPWYSP